jgi:hypothetical protein
MQESRSWHKLAATPKPAARYGHVLAADHPSRRLVLYGGATATGVTGDVWVCDLGAESLPDVALQISPRPPASLRWAPVDTGGCAARVGASGVLLDSAVLAVFGGCDATAMHASRCVHDVASESCMTDTMQSLLIDGARLTSAWTAASLPSPCWFSAVCAAGSRLLAYGGATTSGVLGAVSAAAIDAVLVPSDTPPAAAALPIDPLAMLGVDRLLLPPLQPQQEQQEQPISAPKASSAGRILNVAAASRFIQHALAGNDRFDAARQAVQLFLEQQRSREHQVMADRQARGEL